MRGAKQAPDLTHLVHTSGSHTLTVASTCRFNSAATSRKMVATDFEGDHDQQLAQEFKYCWWVENVISGL